MFNRIVYATDFSDSARAAGEVAMQLAYRPGTEIWAMTVVEPALIPLEVGDEPGDTPPGIWDLELEDVEEQALAAARRQLHSTLTDLGGTDITLHELAVEGDPAGTIIREARSVGADLIVIGCHTRHGVEGLIIGNVASKISEHAPCPVLTVCIHGERNQQ